MASYWKSPYSTGHVSSGRPDSYNTAQPGKVDYSIENRDRLRWFDNGLPTDFRRRLTTHSAIVRREGVQLKGILKSPSEQDPLDLDRMSPFSASNVSSLRGSARSKKDKKRVTFDNGLEGLEENSWSRQSNMSSTSQQKLKLSQTPDESAKYHLKKLLGHYSDHHWPTVRGRITLAKSETYGPLETNGLCRHSAYLKCATCFEKSAAQKEADLKISDTGVFNRPENGPAESGAEKETPRINDVKKSNNFSNTTHQVNIYRPNPMIYISRNKNSLTERYYFPVSGPKTFQAVSDYPSLDTQQNFEVITKLTITSDGKIRTAETDPIKANNKQTPNIRFHTFDVPKTNSSTKLTVNNASGQDRNLPLSKFTFSKQWGLPNLLEQRETTGTRLKQPLH